LIFTTTIEVIISCCLLNEVIYRIKVCIKANKVVLVIAEAVKVAKKIIYKMRLNLDIWGELYTPSTIVLKWPKALLPY